MDVNGSLVMDTTAASEIKRLRVEKVASNPTATIDDIGRLIYNTATKQFLIGRNTTGTTYIWDVVATSAAADITALQAEVDAIELTLGIKADGTFDPTKFTGTLNGQTSYEGLIKRLQVLVANAQTVADAALPKNGGTMMGALNEVTPGTIASALTMDLGSVPANTITVTGTSGITRFGTSAPIGSRRTLIFAGSFGIVHGTFILLPTGTVITTETGDVAEFVCTGSDQWKCISYTRASGVPLAVNSTIGTIQRFNGSPTQLAMSTMSIIETTKVNPLALPATYILYTFQGSIHYNTANATTNWVVNITHSATTKLDVALAVGETITVAHLATQGATAFFLTGIQIDGVVTPVKWQGGVAPTAGNVSGTDVYTFTVIKTAAATFTVLGSITQYK